MHSPSLEWKLGDKTLDCSRPRVIAIVNADPQSFFPGSRISPEPQAMRLRLEELIAAGPDLLDIGGQSTRPGSTPLNALEELERVLPVIQTARELAPDKPITVDTFRAAVAREALAAGADGVNDISAGAFDPELLDVVAGSACGYVLMHMQGTPESMQASPHYEDCAAEVGSFLAEHLAQLEARGIAAGRVVLDPGIGFGKRLQDNLALIREAGRVRTSSSARSGGALSSSARSGGAQVDTATAGGATVRPLLYGLSRKSFIARLLGQAGVAGGEEPEGRLPASLGATWALLEQGVMLHRVHDVADTRQLFALWAALR